MIKLALAIPHTPWRPERVESLGKLMDAIVYDSPHQPVVVKTFTERAPNWVWSREMWRWAIEQNATHFVQLQDDVRPMPQFWEVLHAMVTANPSNWIGLQANHPAARSLAHVGRRWFATAAWLVGCQYVVPIPELAKAVKWIEENDAILTKHQREHEDVLLSTYLVAAKRPLFHPIPAVADVDLAIGSTYAGVDGHIDDHRRPCVTWQGYDAAMLKDPSYWQVPDQVECLRGPGHGVCVICNERPAQSRTKNMIAFCAPCMLDMISSSWGIQLGKAVMAK